MKRMNLNRLFSILLGFAMMLGMIFPVRAANEAEPVTYDFDSGLQGWTVLDADGDGHEWVLVSEFGNVYPYYAELDLSAWTRGGTGDALVSGSYYNGVGALSPDNYLISPKVALGGTISFYAYSTDYYYEQLGVFVSTTGTDPSDFVEVTSWTVDNVQTWAEYTADLSAFEGEGYVAIRNYNTYDQYLVSIDDVTITAPAETHEHEFVFTAEGDTITAVCAAEGCDLEEGVTLRITAPEKSVYGDSLSPLAGLDGLDSFNEITGLSLSTDDIRYYDMSGDTETELSAAPEDAGQYEARISVGEGEDEVTAFVAYEIEKAESELTPPEAKELTYNGEDQELVTAGESEDGTFEYAVAAEGETPAEDAYGSDLPVGKDAGTYDVYCRFIPDANHADADFENPIKVTIAPAALTVTADDQEKVQGEADPELTYTVEGLFGDDAVTGELAREEGEEPGEYAITIGTLDAGLNYVIEFVGAKLIITAPPVIETVNITVKKVWVDDNNKDGVRPDRIIVNLLADGEVVDEAELTAGEDWTFTFENLPKFNGEQEIKYTVTEEKVSGYKCSINGYTITNTRNTPTSPGTGDNSNIWLYAVMMLGSVTLMILTALFVREKGMGKE